MKLGIRMDGTESRFIDLFLDKAKNSVDFSFFELGTAEGYTFSGLCQALVEKNLNGLMVSCDLPNGWSVDQAKMVNNMKRSGINWSLHFDPNHRPEIGANIYFVDGRNLVKELNIQYGFLIDFAFVDGCHGSPCVRADFLSIAPFIKPNGIIAFHDAGIEEQNTDYQNHCGENINVRKALIDLGLIDNKREGWKFIDEIPGDRSRGGEGNSHVIIQKL